MRLAWKFRAFYDLIGGNSSSDPNSKKFIVTATFPKGSDIGELSLNNDKVAIEYNYNLIDYFLTRTRIHKYMDLSILKTFFGKLFFFFHDSQLFREIVHCRIHSI